MKFLLIAGLADSLINFRGPLIAALQAKGLDVHVAAPDIPEGNSIREKLVSMGLSVYNIPLGRTGTSPVADLRTVIAIWKLIRQINPDFVLGYTIKPVVYGSLAAWLARVPRRIALITGVGYAFQGDGERGKLQALVQWLYGMALSRVHLTFFQNPDDLALFQQRGLLDARVRSCLLNGSGVDVERFLPTDLPPAPTTFLMVGRLLGDKGVREYVNAARKLRKKYPNVRVVLVGWIDSNPDAIQQSELDSWIADRSIEFLGRVSDVRPAIADCSVFVLPSYREGTPRTVLEAMAMGRPVITTDAPGCRETVVDGENGFLVPVKSVDALTEAMERFLIDPALGPRMGARGREIAEEKYDVRKVNTVMLNAMGIQ